jgi:hypothetical protein
MMTQNQRRITTLTAESEKGRREASRGDRVHGNRPQRHGATELRARTAADGVGSARSGRGRSTLAEGQQIREQAVGAGNAVR